MVNDNWPGWYYALFDQVRTKMSGWFSYSALIILVMKKNYALGISWIIRQKMKTGFYIK